MAGTSAQTTDGGGSLFGPVEIRAQAAADEVLAGWASGAGTPGASPGAKIPGGAQRYWGVPFACAAVDGGTTPGWVVAGAAGPATIALDGGEAPGGGGPAYLVLLHACTPPPAAGGTGGTGGAEGEEAD